MHFIEVSATTTTTAATTLAVSLLPIAAAATTQLTPLTCCAHGCCIDTLCRPTDYTHGSLSHNGIGDAGAAALATALQSNTTLTTLE